MAARAKDEGAIGPHGSDMKRALRDSAILARAATGVPHKEIGEEFGVSARTVRSVLDRARKTPSVLDARPMALLEDLLRGYARDEADLRSLAWRHADSNPYVSLGALKGAREALDRSAVLLTDLGKLPVDVSLARAEAELNQVAIRMERVLLQLVEGELSAVEAWEEWTRLTTPDTPLFDRPEDQC